METKRLTEYDAIAHAVRISAACPVSRSADAVVTKNYETGAYHVFACPHNIDTGHRVIACVQKWDAKTVQIRTAGANSEFVSIA